ncbi:hypothetical protein D3C75_1341120 [compost metagenome]
MIGAQGKHIECLEIPPGLRDLTKEQHPVANPQLARLGFQILLQSTATEDHQLAVGR